jgi:hypothetical protein
MTATESRLHITVSREFLALLRKAKAGESHRNPGATDEQVLKLALEALVEKQSKRKACVPAKVKREVVKRDQGKCQWKLAEGGPDTIDNCRILCRPHNLEAARRAYGDEVMDLFTRGRSRTGGSTVGEEVAGYLPPARAAAEGAPGPVPETIDSGSAMCFPPAPCARPLCSSPSSLGSPPATPRRPTPPDHARSRCRTW